MKTKNIVVLVMTSLLVAPIWAQDCGSENLTASTPVKRFAMDNGIVTDKETGLVWMRCSLGQSWNGKTCVGTPTSYTWQDAAMIAEDMNVKGFVGHSDWRIPMIPELASIVERNCFDPRVNLEVFPKTPSLVYWSSMERMGSAKHAYSLDFGEGEAKASLKNQHNHVRLVRGGPWWTPPKMPSAEK